MISGMITSLKNNKRERVSTFKKIENFKEGKNIHVQFDKKATPHQLKKIKEKITTENQKLLKRNIIILSIGILLIIYCIGFIKF